MWIYQVIGGSAIGAGWASASPGKANQRFLFLLASPSPGGGTRSTVPRNLCPIPPTPHSCRADPAAQSRDLSLWANFSSSPVSLVALSCMFRCPVHFCCHSDHGYLTQGASLEGNWLWHIITLRCIQEISTNSHHHYWASSWSQAHSCSHCILKTNGERRWVSLWLWGLGELSRAMIGPQSPCWPSHLPAYSLSS